MTLDCDFSHSPEDIPKFLLASDNADVVVGSRWTAMGSLPGWNFYRRMMTGAGHLLTRLVLGLKYDATGAFRAYRLDRVPKELFGLVQSKSYSFFFESLFILHKNACRIDEIPIVLPARTYGHSKMTLRAAAQSVQIMLDVAMKYRRNASAFHLMAPPLAIEPTLYDPQHWEAYWTQSREASKRVYAAIASIYRQVFIRPRLHRILRRQFAAAHFCMLVVAVDRWTKDYTSAAHHGARHLVRRAPALPAAQPVGVHGCSMGTSSQLPYATEASMAIQPWRGRTLHRDGDSSRILDGGVSSCFVRPERSFSSGHARRRRA